VSLKTVALSTGELETNCYLLWPDGGGAAAVFDPGGDAAKIEKELKRRTLTPAAFLLTHCHFDHFGALGELKEKFPQAPIHIPALEAEWLARPTLNLSYFFGTPITGPKAEHPVQPDEVIQFAGLALRAIHVPGHSPGSMAYYAEAPGGAPHVFSGDILFCGGIGRGDLPGATGEEAIVTGIREKLFVLPDDTIVHPGHGPETTIGAEKRSNPFCGVNPSSP
jgi:hydroxyacylglutathione hydrolase